MSNFWQTAISNPKSTISGLLSFVSVTSVAIAPFIPPTASKVCAGVAIAGVLSKAYLGALMKDADRQQAVVPGQGVQSVPAHSMPDDPKDIPVTGKN